MKQTREAAGKINAISKTAIYQKYLKNGIDLLTDIKRFYSKGDYSVKQVILSSIFPEKLFLDKNNCRTTRLNEAPSDNKYQQGFQRNKKRTTPQKIGVVRSGGAERIRTAVQTYSPKAFYMLIS